MEFRKLTPGFGVEVEGADLASLDERDFERIKCAFYEHQVLVARSQKLTADQYLAFARPTGLADAGTYFHTDYSHLEVPARATMLYSIQVPKQGGDTLFANQYAAFEDLPVEKKNQIKDLVALHHYGNRDDLDKASRKVASVLNDEQEKKMSWVRHRIARPHPVTGRTALYSVSGSAFGIEGMGGDESRALLDELTRHATRETYQLRLTYGVGDVVIWDNASLLHSATLTDPQDPRTLWRITVKEEGRPS